MKVETGKWPGVHTFLVMLALRQATRGNVFSLEPALQRGNTQVGHTGQAIMNSKQDMFTDTKKKKKKKFKKYLKASERIKYTTEKNLQTTE